MCVAGPGADKCQACGGFGEACCGGNAPVAQRTCDKGLKCSPPDGGGGPVLASSYRCY
jgi:hypothetical protein